MKTCSKCKQTRSVSEFSSHPNTKDRLQSQCRVCERARMRQKKTGWSPEAFDAAWESQHGTCAICQVEMTRGMGPGALAGCADHCHATGNTRAILCSNCNKGLGKFMDDPEALERAAAYLRHHTR